LTGKKYLYPSILCSVNIGQGDSGKRRSIYEGQYWPSFFFFSAQCMACCSSTFVGGWTRLMPCHFIFSVFPWDPNIWFLGLSELYVVIFVGHVISKEKYECWIEKLSMRN
jgi:hypothetical protein